MRKGPLEFCGIRVALSCCRAVRPVCGLDTCAARGIFCEAKPRKKYLDWGRGSGDFSLTGGLDPALQRDGSFVTPPLTLRWYKKTVPQVPPFSEELPTSSVKETVPAVPPPQKTEKGVVSENRPRFPQTQSQGRATQPRGCAAPIRPLHPRAAPRGFLQ